jgi:hypothetical protein
MSLLRISFMERSWVSIGGLTERPNKEKTQLYGSGIEV